MGSLARSSCSRKAATSGGAAATNPSIIFEFQA